MFEKEAEEYLIKRLRIDIDEFEKWKENNEGEVKFIIDSYIAGAEAHLLQWHKVSEQIPTEEKEYLVKLTDGTIDVMTIALDGDLEPYLLIPKFDFYKDIEKWCEIPEE